MILKTSTSSREEHLYNADIFCADESATIVNQSSSEITKYIKVAPRTLDCTSMEVILVGSMKLSKGTILEISIRDDCFMIILQCKVLY